MSIHKSVRLTNRLPFQMCWCQLAIESDVSPIPVCIRPETVIRFRSNSYHDSYVIRVTAQPEHVNWWICMLLSSQANNYFPIQNQTKRDQKHPTLFDRTGNNYCSHQVRKIITFKSKKEKKNEKKTRDNVSLNCLNMVNGQWSMGNEHKQIFSFFDC